MAADRPTDATATVIADLASAGLTVAVAESLTGGLLVAELIRPAGASAVVVGGVVAYATELKHLLLGVDAGLLAEQGPVHPAVAIEMAVGARDRLTVGGRISDIGLSTTGVAGPDSQGGHPPGTVYIGVSSARGSRSVALNAKGTRDEIRRATVERAVAELRDELAASG